ncbi:MAG TPA: response regulator [Thermoanaerobacterales bacterium]|nr:response regulator [Thermoanaerobacterales bacterium]
MRVLVVDDAAFMRMTLKNIVEKSGHEVVGEADNGKNAVELCKALTAEGKKPDLVTMDITMPEVDGLEGLVRIKELDKSINVIMITAMGQEVMVREAIVKGALDFIVKPFKEDRIRAALTKVESMIKNSKS